MSNLALQIEHELQQAFPVKDEGALKRAASLISEHSVDRTTYAHDISEIRSDIRVLAETMKLGFEQMEKRFEQVDKRFEELVAQSDRRFEQVDKRFEQMEKRFEMLIDQMNRRFDDVQRNFERHMTTIQWGGSLLFGLLAALMSLYKFVN